MKITLMTFRDVPIGKVYISRPEEHFDTEFTTLFIWKKTKENEGAMLAGSYSGHALDLNITKDKTPFWDFHPEKVVGLIEDD